MEVFFGLIAAVIVVGIAKSVRIIGQAEVMVIERLGSFNRVARSGLNILIPFVERAKTIDVRFFESDVTGLKKIVASSTARIDLREQVLNFPSQPVITKDNVTIDIDAVMYYRVADPQKATYSVQNLPYALETLTRTTLRNIVGDIELDQTLASRDMINRRMREVIEEASIGWGVDVTRVELQSIEPPRDIQQSMELQMRAERERRAAVTNAEASKRAVILEAEGLRESQVLKAQGERRPPLRAKVSRKRVRHGQRRGEAIRLIAASLPDEQSTYLLGQKYLDALPPSRRARDDDLLPAEATGMLGALGGLREMLRAQGGGQDTEKRTPGALSSGAPRTLGGGPTDPART
jgi:regulator of protease activity HflC (stomatin/prohibitin superfamily)